MSERTSSVGSPSDGDENVQNTNNSNICNTQTSTDQLDSDGEIKDKDQGRVFTEEVCGKYPLQLKLHPALC